MKILKLVRNPMGLTLIELLAVVVILGIIAAIAIPTFGTIIANTKKDAHISNAIQIAESAKILFNTKSLKIQTFPSEPIKLIELISEGYIFPVKNPSTKGEYYDEQNTTVKILKTGNTYYYYVKLSSSDHSYTPDNKDVYSLTREDINIP